MATAWFTVACLMRLRDEINALAPNRAKGADGTVGDLAHQEHTSDHNPDETGAVPIHDADRLNEVHALDITTELNEPGLTLDMIVQFILARCRSGAERRLRYIIWQRKIYHVDNDFEPRDYDLDDPHTGHAHFSASYDSAREADASTWHLEEIPVALTPADKTWFASTIRSEIAAQLAAMPAKSADATWAKRLDVDTTAKGVNLQTAGDILRYGSSEHHQAIDAARGAEAGVKELRTAIEGITVIEHPSQ